MVESFGRPDFKEGVASFLERRRADSSVAWAPS